MSEAKKLTPAMLSALLCARICHDLISPVGALGAALEVFDDEDNMDMRDDAMELIRTSSKQASGKLQYLRLAFGAGGSAPGIIAISEIKSLVDGMYGDSKATIIWKTQLDGLPKDSARLLLNLIMLAVQAIPRGGDLTIEATDQAGMVRMTLTSAGPRARLADAVAVTLSGKAPDEGWDGRTVQPFYAGMIARENKGKVDARMEGDESVIFSALMPHDS